MGEKLTHFDDRGRAVMVDVGAKEATSRRAVARGEVRMEPATLTRIMDQRLEKGDVFNVARVAGIMAAKKTSDLVPLCHALMLHSVQIDFVPDPSKNLVIIEATVSTSSQTGVEMEALTAVSVAGLTIYDMCKAVDKAMRISNICLVRKTGGKSGDFVRGGETPNG